MADFSGRGFLASLTYLNEHFFFMLIEGLDAAEPVSRCRRHGAYAKSSVSMTSFSISTESE